MQDSLGGNAKTMMVATVGPADYNFNETVGTLQYAQRAKRIKNKPKINEDPKVLDWTDLDQASACSAQPGLGCVVAGVSRGNLALERPAADIGTCC